MMNNLDDWFIANKHANLFLQEQADLIVNL